MSIRLAVFAAFVISAGMAAGPKSFAGEADVVAVKATKWAGGTFRFDVSVRHDDKGWDHYADAWQIVSPDGAVLAERVLAHPHDTEQPFTRALSSVRIPAGIRTVIIRARDNVHGFGGKEVNVALPGRED